MKIPFCQRDDQTGILAALDEAGCVVIEGFFSAELMDSVLAEVDVLRQRAKPDREHVNDTIGWFYGDKTRHLTALVRHSKTLRETILVDPLLQSLCQQVLGPYCSDWQLNVAHFLDRGPKAEAQFMHRDHDVWVHLPKIMTCQLASMMALVDFTEANGATRIVPGSHKWEKGREASAAEIQIAAMPKGSVALYVGGILHGAGANLTDQWRAGMHLSYTLGWLRTEENMSLAIPPAEAKDYSDEVLGLIGYRYYDAMEDEGGYLGLVDLHDPAKLLADGVLG